MYTIKDQITELNQNYNDLGEDILLLEAVILACEGETEFPEEMIESSIERIMDYIHQHMDGIHVLTQFLTAPPRRRAYEIPQ